MEVLFTNLFQEIDDFRNAQLQLQLQFNRNVALEFDLPEAVCQPIPSISNYE